MRIGIDLGGTKIEGITLKNSGEIHQRLRVATPQNDYPGTLQAITALVSDLEGRQKGKLSVGICTPGAISPDSGLLRNSNSVCLNRQPLLQDLERALNRPIRLANDADCFALSEASDGAAAEADSVFGVIIGTGTGGGIVIKGQLLSGPNAIAGEWGHNPLPWPNHSELPGPNCYCGKQGCIETFLSGPGLQRDHGQHINSAEIITAAQAGDRDARATLDRYHDRMARALASVINIIDPEVIVLGGGLSKIESLYTEVPRLWGKYVFSDRVFTHLRPPRHGDSSGVRGAAWLWPSNTSIQDR